MSAQNTLYDYKIDKLNSDEPIAFESFRGKKVLIVNVASKCGYTKQYSALQELYENYKEKLVVVGVPCNQFGGQEPGTEEEIGAFCQKNYGVEFPITEKVDVKGENQHPLYKWLCEKELNGVDDFDVSWNFNKFLIDEKGNLLTSYPSSINPLDEKIIDEL